MQLKRHILNFYQNVHLEHVDLSRNVITATTDLSARKNLNTLMLHSNKITSLRYDNDGDDYKSSDDDDDDDAETHHSDHSRAI